MAKKSPTLKSVETLKHDEAKRKNIPTAEHQSVIQKDQEAPRTVKYPRNTDLDPQLVWRGKDEQDWSERSDRAPRCRSMFRRRWGQTVPCWIRPLGLLKRTSPPSLLCKLRSGRTLPFHSCRTRLPPPLCQTEAHRPPWSCPRSRPRSYPVGTASGASAVSPTARACDTQSFTKRTMTKFEIQIEFIPARSLSFL